MMKILKGVIVTIGIILIYLILIIFLPNIKVVKQPIERIDQRLEIPKNRQDISFECNNQQINGWLYLPQGVNESVPCLILNNGFCGTKDMLLEKYALKFSDSGYAVLTYDYRYFGESAGEPRQLYSVNEQLADNRAAIKYARTRNEIDPNSIVIWGTSSSGSYGIALAAEDQNIAAVIGQTPALDHEKDGKMIFKREGLGWMLKLIMHAQRDKGRSRFGLSAHSFPAVGKPNTTAMLIAPGFYEGYQKIAETSTSFKNEVCARLMLESHGPDLFNCAEDVNCPVLFQICEDDNMVAPNSHKKIESILGGKVKITKYSIDHFEIYYGEHFENSINEQIKFLKEVLI